MRTDMKFNNTRVGTDFSRSPCKDDQKSIFLNTDFTNEFFMTNLEDWQSFIFESLLLRPL